MKNIYVINMTLIKFGQSKCNFQNCISKLFYSVTRLGELKKCINFKSCYKTSYSFFTLQLYKQYVGITFDLHWKIYKELLFKITDFTLITCYSISFKNRNVNWLWKLRLQENERMNEEVINIKEINHMWTDIIEFRFMC